MTGAHGWHLIQVCWLRKLQDAGAAANAASARSGLGGGLALAAIQRVACIIQHQGVRRPACVHADMHAH